MPITKFIWKRIMVANNPFDIMPFDKSAFLNGQLHIKTVHNIKAAGFF